MSVLNSIAIWAYKRNLICGSTPQAQMVKLMEEIGELASGIGKNDKEKIEDSIGDAVVVLTIIAEQCGLDALRCIEIAYDQIKDRKGKMVNGIFVKEGDKCEEN